MRRLPANPYGPDDVPASEWTCDRFEHEPSPGALPRPGRGHPSEHHQGRLASVRAHTCLRYRLAARQGEDVDTSTGHIGFRCVVRGSAGDGP